MRHENLPSERTIWLLFDIDNGHPQSKHYCWWFESRQRAREHKRHQESMNHAAELVGPFKYHVVGDLPAMPFKQWKARQG